MPNTLAHLGVQTLATRAVVRHADVKWIFAGAVIPDVPWIIGRATKTLLPSLHGYELWAYLIAQSSLAVSLLLCGALASVSAAPRRAFAILSLNSLMHLVLDGFQTKWGSGVLLVAPVSWSAWSADWFGVESWPTYTLTALAALIAFWALWRAPGTPLTLVPTTRRLALAGALLLAYLAAPIPLRHGPVAADHQSVGTLRDGGQRAGHAVTFDRVRYLVRDGRHAVRTYAGEELPLASRPLPRSALISARAEFVDDSTLAIRELHEHTGWPRDLLNYVGLALVGLTCLGVVVRRHRPARPAGGTTGSGLR